MRLTMSDLSYTERLEVERLVEEINRTGVGTVDVPKTNGGKRHRLRGPLERALGFKVDYGIDKDWDTGKPFGWFARHEEAVDPETQAARERLGFN